MTGQRRGYRREPCGDRHVRERGQRIRHHIRRRIATDRDRDRRVAAEGERSLRRRVDSMGPERWRDRGARDRQRSVAEGVREADAHPWSADRDVDDLTKGVAREPGLRRQVRRFDQLLGGRPCPHPSRAGSRTRRPTAVTGDNGKGCSRHAETTNRTRDRWSDGSHASAVRCGVATATGLPRSTRRRPAHGAGAPTHDTVVLPSVLNAGIPRATADTVGRPPRWWAGAASCTARIHRYTKSSYDSSAVK